MADDEKISTRYHYQFIHNVFGNFFNDMLEYFGDYLYPRFEYQVVGTYDKAVEYINKKDQYDREIDKPQLPALILNPTGDFGLADAITGAKQPWRFPNLAPGMINRIFDPVYQDDNVLITVGFTRVKGEVELIMLLNSFYEYADLKMLMIQIFGGTDRYIYPSWFNSFVILPSELYNYRYINDVTGLTYKLDWESAGATDQLIKSTAIEEKVIPCTIKPIFKLISLSDGSERYGGTDKVAEWKLNATVEYEVEVPSFVVLETNYLAERIKIEIRYGSAYSRYPNYKPPINRQLTDFSWDWGLDSTSNSVISTDSTSEIDYVADYVFHTRYYHTVSAAEALEEEYLDIDLPEQITAQRSLIVNSKRGELSYWDHYRIIDIGWTLRLLLEYVPITKGQIIELYVYKLIS